MLFRKKIDRYCTYCQFAGKVDEETMICQKYGIVPAAHRCRKFRYDPLKRVPSRPHSGGRLRNRTGCLRLRRRKRPGGALEW